MSTNLTAPQHRVIVLCFDGTANQYGSTVRRLAILSSSDSAQFIGSSESVKAMIYYVTDYITKPQLKTHVAYAALQVAVKKCENVEDADDEVSARSKPLLQKCGYSIQHFLFHT